MRRFFPLLLAALLAACTTTPHSVPVPPAASAASAASTGKTSGAVFPPNPNLHVQGIPPVPTSLVEALAPFADFRGHAFMDWHPTRREMLVTHRQRGGSTSQLYRITGPLAEPQQLTDLPDAVSSAHFEPREGRYAVFSRSVGGNEVYQLYRLDLDSQTTTLLTPEDQRHAFHSWLNQRSLALVSSVPLDRTAVGGTRREVITQLWLMDPQRPGWRQPVADLPGGGWFGAKLSPDDRQLAITRYVSAAESQVWLIDLAGVQAGVQAGTAAPGQRRQLLPQPGGAAASHFTGEFSTDGRSLYVVSDRAGEFREMMRVDLGTDQLQSLTGHIPWDVSDGTATRDGRLLALQVNVDGNDQLRMFNAVSGVESAAPRLPPGNVGSTRFHPSRNELMFSLANARGPSQIYTLDAASGRTEQWTRASIAPGLDVGAFSEQAIIRWPSFDGRSISGLITRPPASFKGKRPVIISVHGGPEAQATVGFLGRSQYFVQNLGITFIQPNVRGSSGFGKTFLSLDNGRLREDSVKDIGALLDWIATQPDLDASRVLVMGGSYGGYVTLAVATNYPERIAGAIDVVGISNFVTFLETTESYRRDLRRVEYGDERDPAMRAFLHSISPLTHAERIKRPLFVVQGRNDPRVPWTEAEQIVAKVRANGTPVWYLRAENEGHGFARRENADFQFYAMVLFMQQTLLK